MTERAVGCAAAVCATLAACALAAAPAAACPCQRPTDPGGYNGYDYGAAPVTSFDGKNVRIWYTKTGPHAVNPATTQADMTPDNVVTAQKVADAALDGYAQMGFSPPISDGGTPGCCGGDGRLDIYLMHFNAADGDTAAEGCQQTGKATKCWSFGQVEARLENIYGSFELGAHVVIAHELMHSVQDGYDQALDRFWAEGTAQWAAKTLDPAETDLESFLPVFFQNAGASIDLGGGGVVADYLYASAIWPVFLTQRVGPTAVRAAFEEEAMLGPPSMRAIDAGLHTLGSSLADAYPTFAAWNAATGKRAGTGGYQNAASYPEAALAPFGASGKASDIVTGYSVFFYAYDFGAQQMQLTLSADPARIGARTFPLVGGSAAGKAALDQLSPLPATVTGAGVVVVAGISGKKSDAPFSVTAAAPPSTSSSTSSSATTTGGAAPAPADQTESSGCALGTGSRSGAFLVALGLVFLAGARRRRCRLGRS